MGAAKPSKKQRGKTKKALKVKAELKPKATLVPVQTQRTTGLGVSLKPAKSVNHVKFGDDGEAAPAVNVVGKKRGRASATTPKPTDTVDAVGEAIAAGGGKSDRSPEMVQAAKYYLEQWKKRDQPRADDDEPWKFKKIKQQWILQWMFEADVIPKSLFSLVLEYLGGLQGAARQRVLELAHEIIDAGVPEKTTTGEDADNADAETQDVAVRLARRRYKRALQVAELLS